MSNKKPNIFLEPRCGPLHKDCLDMIENGINYSEIKKYLSEDGRKILSTHDKLHVWGNQAAKESTWNQMNVDDLILFYTGKEGKEDEGKLFYAGRLQHKEHNTKLCPVLDKLRPVFSWESSWCYLYFLKDLKSVDIPWSVFVKRVGYSHNWACVQGFMVVSKEKVKKIYDEFGNIL